MKGWIYKITYQDAKGGKNRFPGWCYIGQHRGTTIQTRFNGHKNDAKKFVHSGSNREDGKFANLHEAMALARVENFIIEELEAYDIEDEFELINLLRSRETALIEEYDSEPPHLNWSSAMFRKRRTDNDEQTPTAGRDYHEVTAS